MSIRSGKHGVVNGQSTIRNWNINDDANNPRYIASNTRKGAARRNGINSWAGAFNGYGHTPAVMPGEIFAFVGYTAPDDDVSGAGEKATGNAIVDSLVVNWNYAGGEVINHTVNFSGHLGLTWASGTAVSDVTDPELHPLCDVIWEYSLNGTDFFEITDLVSAALTLTSENLSYVNSSTGCNTGRKAGNLDWTLALVQQDVVRGAYAFDKGDDLVLRGYVDDTDFWLLKWGKVKNFSNITVDIETGAIIQRTINIEMNGFTSAIGQIRKPGAVSDWWPA